MRITSNFMKMLVILAVLVPAIAYAGTSGPSPIPPPPNFQISTNAITLCKGIINNVPISVKTPQGASRMEDLQFSIVNSRNAYLVGNGTVSAVNVTANVPQTIILPVFVTLNSSSLISAGVGINYQYDTLYTDSEIRNISFGTETCPTTLSLKVSPQVLISGKIENLTLNLTNEGPLPLNFISIKGTLPGQDGTFLGAQPIQVASINPGSTVKISQSVFVYKNATQSFPVNFSINLYNGTSLEQIAYSPIVLSTGIINITGSSVTLSPQNPTPGSVFSISFVLTDVGTSSASAVTATPLNPVGFEPYGSNSVFVGDMQVDTQTPVTLTMTTLSTVKNGTYQIPVRISYLNGLRQNVSTIFTVPVVMSKAATFNSIASGYTARRSSASGVFLIIMVILLIAVIVLAVLLYKEKKKNSKNQKK